MFQNTLYVLNKEKYISGIKMYLYEEYFCYICDLKQIFILKSKQFSFYKYLEFPYSKPCEVIINIKEILIDLKKFIYVSEEIIWSYVNDLDNKFANMCLINKFTRNFLDLDEIDKKYSYETNSIISKLKYFEENNLISIIESFIMFNEFSVSFKSTASIF